MLKKINLKTVLVLKNTEHENLLHDPSNKQVILNGLLTTIT